MPIGAIWVSASVKASAARSSGGKIKWVACRSGSGSFVV
jgi:hypothetical protein